VPRAAIWAYKLRLLTGNNTASGGGDPCSRVLAPIATSVAKCRTLPKGPEKSCGPIGSGARIRLLTRRWSRINVQGTLGVRAR